MPESEDSLTQRPIRSFVRRSGRMTRSQRLALEHYWPRYVLEGKGLLDLDRSFGRQASRFLEIGFGMGDQLVAMAQSHQERDYLGIEVYDPGVGRLLRRLASLDLHNVRVIRADAADVLKDRIPEDCLDGVLLLFPDPWPKKRHHKRRIVQPAFVSLVCARLRPGGCFQLATDWEDYARHMRDVVDREPGLVNLAGPGCFSPRPAERPLTKFERRAARLGNRVWDLVYERRLPKNSGHDHTREMVALTKR